MAVDACRFADRVNAMILHLDCANGVSGDMLVAALLDLAGAQPGKKGPLERVVRPALKAAGIDPRLVRIEKTSSAGVEALSFRVADAPGFATFDELILAMYASGGDEAVADVVAGVAKRMAAAESEVHGTEEVHLHELSGIDTAVDLISAAVLVHHLAPERVTASPPALGDGVVHTAHGELPVPAPAVVALLRGLPVTEEPRDAEHPAGELTTPTGAALLAHFVRAFGPPPDGTVSATGCGAGARVLLNRPNVLWAMLIDPTRKPERKTEMARDLPQESGKDGGAGALGEHVLLETNIDDMSPELFAHAADVLREAGAADVWATPAYMKKGRPGMVLHVLAAAAARDRLATVLFAETSTFGLRVLPVGRLYADERRETVHIAGKDIAVRLAFVDGRLVTVSPEFEDVRAVAAAVDRPVKVVYEAAQAAARNRFSTS
jgi:pyridinium-3,5-bisthiocarboxylic acid mononucleotide nickel chelatase